MDFWHNKKIRFSIIGVLVLLCAVLAFVIRIIPQADLAGSGDMIAGPDAWYNLRLVEYLLQNGVYLNFDPMTQYPGGSVVGWGPVFTYLSSIFAIIAGAASRIAIIDAVSWVPAVLGMLVVPVMFFLGRKLGDWKTGVIAALFIAIIGGQYFSRSLYGHFDHHIAETFFLVLFSLCYVLALAHTKDKKIEWKKLSTIIVPLLFGVLSGIAYLLGILTMFTFIVFGLFVAVFTLIQFIIDYKHGHPTEYLLILNTLTFGIAAIGQAIYGIRSGFDLTNYSQGLLIAQILVIVGTLVLYLLTIATDKIKKILDFQKPWLFYILGIIIVGILGAIVCAVAFPDVFQMIVDNISVRFTPMTDGSTTIQEAAPWSWDRAVSSFNWSLLLAFCGAVVLVVKTIKEKNPLTNFVFWWSLGTFVLACAQIRWEYFFAANIALLSAVFVGWAISISIPEIRKLVALFKSKSAAKKIVEEPARKGKNSRRIQQEIAKNKPNVLKLILLVLTLVVAGVFVGFSLSDDIYKSSYSGTAATTAPYWLDACEWMKENTPETGIDYYGVYDKSTYKMPKTAYGVVAWWDFGHYITTIAERLPVANPFQAGVTGKYGVATLLMETDESVVAKKFDQKNNKYVMVDYNTGNNFIPVMAVWIGKSIDSYKDYYNTLAFRLYNMAGSENPSYGIQALQHFRLVYDSPKYVGTYDASGNVVGQNARVFEYVKGAVIKGEGTISTTLKTNSGLSRTYEQTSVNGQFVVPYATGANGAITASPYTITGTGQTFTVSEEQVQNGLTVN